MGKETYQITEYVHDQVIAYCRDATKEAMPILYKVQKGEDPSPEMVKGLTATYGQWFVNTIEKVGVGREMKK